MEGDVAPLAEMLARDDVDGAAQGHDGRMGDPNLDSAGVSIMVRTVKFNEPVPVDVNVNALDVDGIATPGVSALLPLMKAYRFSSSLILTPSSSNRGAMGAEFTNALHAGGDPI
jgi:hypothetical protein